MLQAKCGPACLDADVEGRRRDRRESAVVFPQLGVTVRGARGPRAGRLRPRAASHAGPGVVHRPDRPSVGCLAPGPGVAASMRALLSILGMYR
jgi:hypothetical protein